MPVFGWHKGNPAIFSRGEEVNLRSTFPFRTCCPGEDCVRFLNVRMVVGGHIARNGGKSQAQAIIEACLLTALVV